MSHRHQLYHHINHSVPKIHLPNIFQISPFSLNYLYFFNPSLSYSVYALFASLILSFMQPTRMIYLKEMAMLLLFLNVVNSSLLIH